jgi:predicted ArsR family transcriptional regulator
MVAVSDNASDVARVAALDHPIRRDVYRLLIDADDWLSRDQVVEALDLPRSVAVFHLDKLAEAGVLEVRFERTTGRSGPGAGRPSKFYRPTGPEVSASIPDRNYDLAGIMLASAVNEATVTGAPVADCLREVAHSAGHELGADAATAAAGSGNENERLAAVSGVLAAHGYDPQQTGHDIVLKNCPFHRLAQAHRSLVCGMNRDFLDGLIAGLGESDVLDALLDPQPGYCCVRISAA